MRETAQSFRVVGTIGLAFALVTSLGAVETARAQAPAGRGGFRRRRIPRPAATYKFTETNEDMKFALFVSSKVTKDRKAPLIVALHGLGGDGNSLLRGASLGAGRGRRLHPGWSDGIQPERLVRLTRDRHGRPRSRSQSCSRVARRPPAGAAAAAPAGPPPERLAQLSELDVRTVMKMIREEFTVDDSGRT